MKLVTASGRYDGWYFECQCHCKGGVICFFLLLFFAMPHHYAKPKLWKCAGAICKKGGKLNTKQDLLQQLFGITKCFLPSKFRSEDPIFQEKVLFRTVFTFLSEMTFKKRFAIVKIFLAQAEDSLPRKPNAFSKRIQLNDILYSQNLQNSNTWVEYSQLLKSHVEENVEDLSVY